MTAPEDPNGLREAPEPIPQNYSWHTASATFYNHSGENWVGITSPFHRKWQPRYHEFPLWTPKGPLRDASDAAWAALIAERDAAVAWADDLATAAEAKLDEERRESARLALAVTEGQAEIARLKRHAESVCASELREAAQFVHDTFARDIAQGYRTKDKVFAVSNLGAALTAAPAKKA